MQYYFPTKQIRPFSVGDKVEVMNGDHSHCGWDKVAKIVRKAPHVGYDNNPKRKPNYYIITKSGRTWTPTGWWIGGNGIWPFPWIRHAKERLVNKK